MNAPVPTLDDVRAAVDRLLMDKRASCLWFVRRGYAPAGDRERLALLRSLEAHADRETYIRTRELREWLSQLSNEKQSVFCRPEAIEPPPTNGR